MADTAKKALNSAHNEAQYQRVDKGYDYPGKLISTIEFRKLGVIHLHISAHRGRRFRLNVDAISA